MEKKRKFCSDCEIKLEFLGKLNKKVALYGCPRCHKVYYVSAPV